MKDTMEISQTFSAGVGIDAYFAAVSEIQKKVLESQRGILGKVAEQMAQTILAGGRIFVFGTGHSHMLAEEGYCRAGGLMSVQPIFYTALMLHESIPLEAKVERTPGLAADLLDRSGIKEGEMLVVPKGVEHKPVAEEEVLLMLFEPKATKHTGEVESELTVRKYDYI